MADLAAPTWRPLPGGTVVWVFMLVEVVTFGMFLLGHTAGWRDQPADFASAQALLHPDSAVRGTVILLLGSGAAYQAPLAMEDGRPRTAAAWLLATALSGLVFGANKIAEYASPSLTGIGLSSGPFWFGYLFITVMHLLHVLAGVGLLAAVAGPLWRGRVEAESSLHVEALAAYWHLVDVVWLLVFPILYLVRP